MKKFILLIQLSLSILVPVRAQEIIEGNVKDKGGSPLPGATVLVKGTNTYALSDANGHFNIESKEIPFTLLISSVGFENQEVEIYEILDEPIEVLLKSNNLLDEIVVVGYGIQKKSDLTGAIASVSETILKQPVSSIDRALQGAVAGVQVVQTSGQPGGGVSIRIRGGSSIQGGNEPLYVIDGYPIYSSSSTAGTASGAEINPLASINPSDIESIDILKDASATAIYGSRGANGVIIVTTKKGKQDQTRLTYDGSYGVQNLRQKIDVLTSPQFASLRNDALYDNNPGGGRYQYMTQQEIDALDKGTDWQDEAFQSAPVQNHQLSLNGGSEKVRYAVSSGYFKQDGIIRNTDFTRLSGRINLDIRASDRLSIGTTLTGSRTKSNIAPSGIVTALLTMPPTATIYEEDGSYTLRNPFENVFSNPIAALNEQTNNSFTDRLLGTVYGEYTIFNGLQLRVSLGTDIYNSRENSYVPSTIYEGNLTGGQANIGLLNSSSWLNENTLTYTREFGQHSVNVLAGFTQQEYTRDIVRTGSQNFVTDDFTYNSLQSGATILTPYSDNTQWGLLSYLGRVNYSFNDRYFVTGSLRVDGSSRFGKNNKWGYFPSAAISWKLTNESFFASLPSVINDLKIRASFGATGNQEIGEFQSLSTLTTVSYLIGDQVVKGFTPSRIANDDLGWEKTYQFDAGLDATFFSSRLTLTLDVYQKQTEDLLLNVEIPLTTGQSTSLQNFGSVRNRGLEVAINSINIESDLRWTTGLNLSFNRNEVTSIGNVNSDNYITGNYLVKVGKPLGTFYGTVTDGILQVGEEEAKGSYTGSATPKAGDRLYKDFSGDNRFTTALDRTIIGNAQPDFIFGFTNTLAWKGFDLTFLFQGSKGNQIINGNRQTLELFNGQQNAASSALERWTESNPSTTMPRAKVDPAPVFSDRFVEDGSFIRLKTLNVGYTLPDAITKRMNISSVRFYIIAQNLLTWTKYTGFDPEITSGNNTTQQGTDSGIYPVSRSISGGLTVSF